VFIRVQLWFQLIMTTDPAQHDDAAYAGMDAPPMTHVPAPRDRIFLPQTFRERVLVFWWSVVRLLLFRFSPNFFNAWRVLVLRLFGARIQRPVTIDRTARIEFPWNLRLESGVFIAHQVIINCMGEVIIGERSRISQYSHIISGTHDYTSRDMRIERRPITIGKDVWIAADAFVGPGVTIGDGCLLAARSSAFRDLPPGQVCVGEPAKAVHARFESPPSPHPVQPLAA
jgi:putative colanic acid biosynthesis acetyltransferase WcaF